MRIWRSSISTRVASELIGVVVLLRIVGWLADTPDQPDARAAHLCAPLRAIESALDGLATAMSDSGALMHAAQPWRGGAYRTCTRVVARVSIPDEEP
ncbi:MAG TPA: hypothetical protein VF229_02525 [Burkholderiaceae bacterium]